MSRTPFVAQMEATECGAACLAMILGHFGHHIGLSDLRGLASVSRDGASAGALMRAASSLGLNGTAHSVELHELEGRGFPAILHWEFNHFVVLTGVTKSGLRILDPAVGPRHIPFGKAEEAFTGVHLTFSTTPSFVRRAPTSSKLGRYWALVARAKTALSLAALSAFVLELVGLVFPIATQVAVDFIIRPRQPRFIYVVGAALAVALVLRTLISLARIRIMTGIRTNLDTWLIVGFVEHLVRLPLAFFSQRSVGDLSNRAHAHSAIRDVLRNLSTTILDVFMVLAYAALVLAYNLHLGGIVIGLTLVRLSFVLMLQRWVRDSVANEIVAGSRESSVLAEAFSAPEAIKGLALETHVRERYVDCSTSRFNAGLARQRAEQNVRQFFPLLDAVGLALIYWIGGGLVSTDKMTVGVLAAFLAVAGLLGRPLGSIISAAGSIPSLRQLLRRMDDVWETQPEPRGNIDPGIVEGSIRLCNVGVRYASGSAPALSNINVEIAPGERITIVGPSGSGKSTLARLIAGLATPTSGQLFFDRVDMRNIDPQKRHVQVGVVLPDADQFVGTVRENIALADVECPLADIEFAASLACVHRDLQALPDGYDAQLGPRGASLSGGQMQRVAIARALLKAPRILILDEATSSLDVALEQRILSNLATLDCTQIVISHRPSAMQDADRIIVLAEGRLMDQGTRAELLQRCEVFRDILRAQREVTL